MRMIAVEFPGSIPHVCGGEPEYSIRTRRLLTYVFPTCVGVNRTQDPFGNFTINDVFPTCVGVNRDAGQIRKDHSKVFPTCVGVNRIDCGKFLQSMYSPRVWG